MRQIYEMMRRQTRSPIQRPRLRVRHARAEPAFFFRKVFHNDTGDHLLSGMQGADATVRTAGDVGSWILSARGRVV